MARIKGMDVTLVVKTQNGTDSFNRPIYAETRTTVHDVLVAQPTTDDITTATDLYGKRLAYTLGIPKGDTHNWIDTEVEFFGKKFRTFGLPEEGIEANVPTRWHKKVKVELFE